MTFALSQNYRNLNIGIQTVPVTYRKRTSMYATVYICLVLNQTYSIPLRQLLEQQTRGLYAEIRTSFGKVSSSFATIYFT